MAFNAQNVTSAGWFGLGLKKERQVAAERDYYKKGLKRVLDVALVLCAAPVAFTLIAIMSLLVVLEGYSPFYTQKRIGRDGKIFHIFKLRSMIPNADAFLETFLADNPEAKAEWDNTQKLKDDPRVTRVGRFLRQTSMDELPQLFNVLKGDMSLVGPRPMMLEQQDLYKGDSYYNLRPGLTGLWQVSDRNASSFRAREKFDDTYSETVSLKTDVSVLFQTVSVVLRRTGC